MILKLADFGCAREIYSLGKPLTDYVSTRWYRAPEILLGSKKYSASVDIFALGCVMAELILGRPLAQGNSQADQVSKLVTVLGSPNDWPEAYDLAEKADIQISKNQGA